METLYDTHRGRQILHLTNNTKKVYFNIQRSLEIGWISKSAQHLKIILIPRIQTFEHRNSSKTHSQS
jgi:uncharacterized pyridoxamine 5'-phosphate oxidase family protein